MSWLNFLKTISELMDYAETAAVIALSRLKGVGAPFLQILNEKGISAAEFLAMTPAQQGAACSLAQMPQWSEAEIREAKATGEKEALFCQRHKVKILSPILDGYPRRLAILDEAPTVLFVLGNADLDALHIIGVVGTRRITPPGDRFCRKFVKELGYLVTNPLIVSGLAYGTDAAAHQSALDNNLPTAAVLAHGLSMIYPAPHRQLAERILHQGGALISQYLSEQKPFRGNFLQRNRVIAALSDGVMIIESAMKGGAMNTAHAAFDFSRSVMALPGRPTDAMSEGCNHLIRHQIATLTTDARQACHTLGWETAKEKPQTADPTLFRQPDSELMPVYTLLQQSDAPVGIDFIMMKCGLPPARLTAMLFALEEDGFIVRLPNNRYTII